MRVRARRLPVRVRLLSALETPGILALSLTLALTLALNLSYLTLTLTLN